MARSARTASLEAQRNPYLRRRVLSPTSTAINTIARKTATSELAIMTDKYNAGLVSNEEFRTFLQKQLTNIGISEADKAEIEIQIKDFDSLVRKDQLEAVFKSAPENSLAKVSAATALSNFYKDRAATMQAGTPAQSQALENAGQWENQAVSIQNTVEKKARSNMRYLDEQKVYQLPTGSSDQAYAKAQMYTKLGDQAASDGDGTEANRFYAQAQQYLTMGDQYVSKEGDKAVREQRTNVLAYLNGAINGYHDGTVDAKTMYEVLSEVDAWAVENNDTSLQLKVNSESDRIAKIEAKGGLKRGTVGGGLPVVLGKGKGGSGTATNWDESDYSYSNGLRAFDAEYKAGLSNAQEYADSVGELLEGRQQDLVSRLQTAEAVAAENPNAKIMFNGKKTRAEEVVQSIYDELDELDGQVDAYNKGNFVLMEIPPDQFNLSGTMKKSGKNVATYQLVDFTAIPPEAQDNYMMDEDGVLHMVQGENVPLTAEMALQASGGYYVDPATGQSYKVFTDPKSGLQTIRMNSRVDLYDPTDRTKKVSLTLTGSEETIPSYEKYVNAELEKEAQIAQAKDTASKKQMDITVPDLTKVTPSAVQKVGELNQQAGKVVQNLLPQPVKEVVQNPMETVKTAVEDVKAIAPVVLPKVKEAIQQSPISYFSDRINAPTPSQMGSTSTLSPITGQPYKPTIQVNDRTMVKQYDPTKQQIQYQQVKPAPYLTQNQQKPTIGTKIVDTLKKSPFDFLKDQAKKALGFSRI